jgi:hypothetical protein
MPARLAVDWAPGYAPAKKSPLHPEMSGAVGCLSLTGWIVAPSGRQGFPDTGLDDSHLRCHGEIASDDFTYRAYAVPFISIHGCIDAAVRPELD